MIFYEYNNNNNNHSFIINYNEIINKLFIKLVVIVDYYVYKISIYIC
jgi:hypothetical protein